MTRKAAGVLGIAITAIAAAIIVAFPSLSYGVETKTVSFDPVVVGQPRSQPILIGANVHFGLRRVLGYTSPPLAVEQLHSIGADSFRDYLPWGSYDLTGSDAKLVYSQRLMKLFLPQAGMTSVINLGSRNGSVVGGTPPISDEGMIAFKRYLKQAVADTREYDPLYEIWNEWNLAVDDGVKRPRLVGVGTPDDPRAAVNYVRVAKSATSAIRAVDPKARILVGAVGDDPDWLWTKAIVTGGAMDGADGLSVHLYNHCLKPRDRTAREMVDRIGKLQTMLKQVRKVDTPIYVTEFSWPTGGQCALPLDVSADNFAQFILEVAPLDWVKGIWMHELKNITADPNDMESNFGVYTFTNQPKPSACFMREATAIVRSADYVDVRQPFADVFVVRARVKDRQKIIVWTSTKYVSAKYQMPKAAFAGKVMCSDETIPAGGAADMRPEPVVYDLDAGSKVDVQVTN